MDFRKALKTLSIAIGILLLNSAFWGPCDRSKPLDSTIASFDPDRGELLQDLKSFTSEAHPFGSDGQKRYQAKLIERLKSLGLIVIEQEFTSITPNRAAFAHGSSPSVMSNLTVNKSGKNIYATLKNWTEAKSNCVSLIGSHYDTKEISNFQYLGANDGGSSTVGLIALASFLNSSAEAKLKCRPWFVWFDGEESVLNGWNDAQRSGLLEITDNTYGSRFAASKLVDCKEASVSGKCLPSEFGEDQKPIEEVIVVDMVGHKNLIFSLESHSDKQLFERLRKSLDILKKPNLLGVHPKFIEDDHIPFKKLGIPVIDLINFEEVDTWHQNSDTLENVNLESIVTAMQVVLVFLQTK